MWFTGEFKCHYIMNTRSYVTYSLQCWSYQILTQRKNKLWHLSKTLHTHRDGYTFVKFTLNMPNYVDINNIYFYLEQRHDFVNQKVSRSLVYTAKN